MPGPGPGNGATIHIRPSYRSIGMCRTRPLDVSPALNVADAPSKALQFGSVACVIPNIRVRWHFRCKQAAAGCIRVSAPHVKWVGVPRQATEFTACIRELCRSGQRHASELWILFRVPPRAYFVAEFPRSHSECSRYADETEPFCLILSWVSWKPAARFTAE